MPRFCTNIYICKDSRKTSYWDEGQIRDDAC
jgi:hypothetical protein